MDGSGDHHDAEQEQPAWLHGHPHEPNPAPPGTDPAFTFVLPGETARKVALVDLAQMPQTQVADCYIVSTGHPSSGPFTFGGVRLIDFLAACLPTGFAWSTLDVISSDGFGNRIAADELDRHSTRPILLSTHIDDVTMTRAAGLLRLIVPSETDDALRQVKWVAQIVIHA